MLRCVTEGVHVLLRLPLLLYIFTKQMKCSFYISLENIKYLTIIFVSTKIANNCEAPILSNWFVPGQISQNLSV